MEFVVDASFLAWTINEPAQLTAENRIAFRLYLSRRQMVGPQLLHYELGNALRKKWLAADSRVRISLHSELMADVRLEPIEDDAVTRIHELADQHGISFYDAAYLGVAVAKPGRILVTQDRELRDAGVRALGASRALDGAAVLELFKSRGPFP